MAERGKVRFTNPQGRPTLEADTPTVFVHLKVPASLKRAVERLAGRGQASSMWRAAMCAYLEAASSASEE